MSWEAVGALATLASALVISVTAIAALVQLRHLRAANQLEAILRIYDRFNDPEMAAARFFCVNELPRLLEDESYLRNAIDVGLEPRATHVGNFYNQLGQMVLDGFLDQQIVIPLVPSAARIWRIVAPIAISWRQVRPDPVWADFEYVASLERGLTRERHLLRFPPEFRRRLETEGRPSLGADGP